MPPGAVAYRERVRASVRSASWAARAGGVGGFAALTGLLAQVEVYAPWNPYVPYTGQLFAVTLSGLVLGPGLGAASMGVYLLLGATGLPVFADWSQGIGVLKGRTAGYLFGFVAAAWVTGHLARHYQRGAGVRRLAVVGAAGATATVAVFGVGAIVVGLPRAVATEGLGATVLISSGFIVGVGCVLWAWSRDESAAFFARVGAALCGSAVVFVPGVAVLKATSGLGWADAVGFGVLPFLPLDLAKAFLAASAAAFVLPPSDP
jgi:biotin transporter BioY